MKNIFKEIPASLPEEFVEVISKGKGLRIERIISRGHSSADSFWYDQEKDEFVMLLKGSAGLAFKGREDVIILRPGDYLNIAAHMKHRVEWTDKDEDTIWLAIHY